MDGCVAVAVAEAVAVAVAVAGAVAEVAAVAAAVAVAEAAAVAVAVCTIHIFPVSRVMGHSPFPYESWVMFRIPYKYSRISYTI